MHAKLAILSVLGVFLVSTDASAQGLLALQNQAQIRESQPLTFTLGANGGYDRLNYKSEKSGLEDIDSFFVQGTLGAIYSEADPQTPWSVGADFGVLNYLDDTAGADETYYNARVAFNIVHQASKRLRLANNFYATYEVEPDYAIGASTSLRNGQYFYGYENFAVSYAWSERMSTTTSYTLDGIRYDDDDLARTEDRLSHIIAQQFSYSLNRNTKLVGETATGSPTTTQLRTITHLTTSWRESIMPGASAHRDRFVVVLNCINQTAWMKPRPTLKLASIMPPARRPACISMDRLASTVLSWVTTTPVTHTGLVSRRIIV